MKGEEDCARENSSFNGYNLKSKTNIASTTSVARFCKGRFRCRELQTFFSVVFSLYRFKSYLAICITYKQRRLENMEKTLTCLQWGDVI